MSYLRQGDAARAGPDLDAAIQRDPSLSPAYLERGRLLARQGQHQRAIEDFTESIRHNNNYGAAFRSRAMSHQKLGDHQRAIADFGEAVRLDAKDALSANELAWLLATSPHAGLRDGKRAVGLARTACELAGWKNPGFLDTYAAALAEAGQFEEAARWQEKALEFPEFRRAEGARARERLALYLERKPFRAQ